MLEFVGKISAYQYVDETFKHFVNEDFIVVFAVLKILQSDYISRSSRFFSWFPRYLALVDCLSKTSSAQFVFQIMPEIMLVPK